jgi:hypothetical protein
LLGKPKRQSLICLFVSFIGFSRPHDLTGRGRPRWPRSVVLS